MNTEIFTYSCSFDKTYYFSSVSALTYPVQSLSKTNKPGTAQVGLYLRLENIQGPTFGKTWNKIFFQRKVFGKKKSHIAEKPKKIPLWLIKRFSQIENFEKFKGVPFDRIQNISAKMSHSAEKNRKGEPLVSPLLLEA